MRLYLAAPVSQESDRKINMLVASVLRVMGHTVLMPQEAGVTLEIAKDWKKDMIYNSYEEAYAAAQEHLWKKDIEMMNSAHACFVVLSRPASEGTCAEIGYMTAQHKPVVGIKPEDLKVGTVLTRTVKWFEMTPTRGTELLCKEATACL